MTAPFLKKTYRMEKGLCFRNTEVADSTGEEENERGSKIVGSIKDCREGGGSCPARMSCAAAFKTFAHVHLGALHPTAEHPEEASLRTSKSTALSPFQGARRRAQKKKRKTRGENSAGEKLVSVCVSKRGRRPAILC